MQPVNGHMHSTHAQQDADSGTESEEGEAQPSQRQEQTAAPAPAALPNGTAHQHTNGHAIHESGQLQQVNGMHEDETESDKDDDVGEANGDDSMQARSQVVPTVSAEDVCCEQHPLQCCTVV